MAKLGFAFGVLIWAVMALSLHKSEATQFIVGGAKGWGVSMAQSYNQWAEANRFQIGDSLVFNYAADQDSVLQVTQDAYANCSIQAPIKQYSDGHTVFQFDKSGAYYFISGNKAHCLKDEKLVVVVLADRTNSTTLPPPPSAPSPAPPNDQTWPPSPSPSGSNETNPSPPPPTVEISPSPAPSGQEAPPPTVEISPAAPISPPPSLGYSIIPSSIGSIGAFVAAAAAAILA
ncbi:early nodulin-like protein 3 [Cucurbita pepo subsp. pepo]|uniref:early nodulin-like protein 3 n=1 Tax=Cucurbita pepo subsp. pepo TaxID=3664 RepID=UPI000C9D5EE5|nr:early nodulin-like protein 3 [Cucurbita pepo subsp. pepo]XP_023525497.1 early nodulin-like protein 3 [Cucurbita pepo subsp. pepo]